MERYINGTILLSIIFILDLLLLFYIKKTQKKSDLSKYFSYCLLCILSIVLGQLLQLIYYIKTGIESIYFEYFNYIALNLLPVFIIFACLSLEHTAVVFKKSYFFLFIMVFINLALLWTNDWHHQYFINYSMHMKKITTGYLYWIYEIFTDILYIISVIYLLRTSLRSKGFFSRQSLLLIIAITIPVVVNIIGLLKIIPISIYSISLTFSFSIFFCAMAIFKYNMFDVSPMALSKIIDNMSDSYIVLNKNNIIVDYNNTFAINFLPKNKNIKGLNFFNLSSDKTLFAFSKTFNKAIKSKEQTSIKLYDEKTHKYFIVQISPLIVNDIFTGTFILLKDVSQHEKDMKKLKQTQETLVENERLSSLGQLMGGISNNLKTPLTLIDDTTENLKTLVTKYKESIDVPNVNTKELHEISKNMENDIKKIQESLSYMSDVITVVKDQVVNLSETDNISFTLDELIKRIVILTKNELSNASINLNLKVNVDKKTTVNGDINNLLQVINNMIMNSMQSYNGSKNKDIDLSFDESDNNLVITIKDYGPGIPENIKDKLFKEVISTKGKNGTGLGLYMSYSTIKVHFHGNLTFESEKDMGTTFYIKVPI